MADNLPVIWVDKLEKVFEDGVHAVNSVSFEVHEGEISGFLDTNGTSKTVTIPVLTTLTRLVSSLAEAIGHDVVKELGEIQTSTGLVPQGPTVGEEFPGHENLEPPAAPYHLQSDVARYSSVTLAADGSHRLTPQTLIGATHSLPSDSLWTGVFSSVMMPIGASVTRGGS